MGACYHIDTVTCENCSPYRSEAPYISDNLYRPFGWPKPGQVVEYDPKCPPRVNWLDPFGWYDGETAQQDAAWRDLAGL